MPWILLGIIISYLLGSIPTAYLAGRLKGVDIRKLGSGNVGATNALRVLGPKAGITVLIIDILKGLVSVVFVSDFILSKTVILDAGLIRVLDGFCCVLGHNWTVFLNFKGGKGVATTIGVLLGLALKLEGLKVIFGLVILTWLAVFLISRIVSAASMLAAITIPIYMLIFKASGYLIASGTVIAVFIIVRHASNVRRIFLGKEPRFHFKRSAG